ncbi:MAG: pyridoxamine 5'-phosphate oxidase [Phycisphaerae bacterium]|nr:MAG: pyridoxamine 5'-phosphate oxidase [Phycisphaerae bacterium]
MSQPVSDIAFSPSVKSVQEKLGSRKSYARMEQMAGWNGTITSPAAAFIAETDMFFLATVNAENQPYVQRRGGPKGFLKVLNENTLGFADYSGNRQYISVGNLDDNPKACIYMMNFVDGQRIKIWGRAEIVEADDTLRQKLVDPDYGAKVERCVLFHVEAWDANCKKYSTPRFTQEEIQPIVQPLRNRIAALEAEVERLRNS